MWTVTCLVQDVRMWLTAERHWTDNREYAGRFYKESEAQAWAMTEEERTHFGWKAEFVEGANV